jgi:iodotyrosine deiodinase
MSTNAPHIPLQTIQRSPAEMLERATDFLHLMERRRSVRHFSDEPVPLDVINAIVRTAATAPSGAHKQPWMFCIVGDPLLKAQIREAAEEEERINYGGRMSAEWLRDLEPFGTDHHKPFLETAPWLVVVFKKAYDNEGSDRRKNYYVNESVGIATGMLLTAAHHAGLATLTHTPSPMDFLSSLLERPSNERPYLLIPMGLPAEKCMVPDLRRKPFEAVCRTYLGA